MGATPAITASDCAAALDALRDRPPLVQSLTNIVVAQWTANVLLAVGAAPAMVDNPHEAAAFARIAGGVLVNLGEPSVLASARYLLVGFGLAAVLGVLPARAASRPAVGSTAERSTSTTTTAAA